jgi:Concanavalin A-like lectin/glucanases superfamily
MAIAYESDGGTVFAASANNNAITVTLAPTRPVGAVLLFVGWCRLITATVGTAPSGYTLLGTFTSATASGGRIWLYAKEVIGGETAPTFAVSNAATGNSGDLWGATIYCYSGVDLSGGIANILDGTPQVQDAAGTTSCTYPVITNNQVGNQVVRFLARFRDAADTFTPTGSHAEREDAGSTVRTGAQHHLQDMVTTATGTQASVTVAPSNTTSSRYLAVSALLKMGALQVDSDEQRLVWDTRAEANSPETELVWDLYRRAGGGAYRDEVMADSPALYWRLGETSGTIANDETANNRDGTYTGVYELATSAYGHSEISAGEPQIGEPGAGLVEGDPDHAAYATVGGGGMQIQSSYNPFVNGTQRTFECLWNGGGVFAAMSLIGGNAASAVPHWDLNTLSGNIRFVPNDTLTGATNVATWTSVIGPVNAGRSRHLAVTFDEPNDVAELFVNGVSQGTRTGIVAQYASPGNFVAGSRRATITGAVQGWIDEVAVYEGILSAERIAVHARAAKSQKLKADVYAAVDSDPIELIWDLAGQAAEPVDSEIAELIWDLYAGADSSQQRLVWDTRAGVDSASQGLIWDTRAAANSSTQDLIWDLRSAVDAAQHRLVWDLRTAINSAQQRLVWDMRAGVNSATQELIWDLRAAVNAAQTLRWDLAAQVVSDVIELIWDMAAFGAVNSAPLSLVWDLRAAASSAQQRLLWDLRSAASSDPQELIWDLYTVAEASRALSWDLRAAVTSAVLDLVWDVRAPVTSSERLLVWDLHSSVNSAPIELIWDLLSQLPDYVDYTGPLTLTVDPIVRGLAVGAVLRTLAVDGISARGLAVDAGEVRGLAVDPKQTTLSVDNVPTTLEVDP